jgi:hypothetical protein
MGQLAYYTSFQFNAAVVDTLSLDIACSFNSIDITGSAVTAVDLNTGPVAWMNHCVFLVLYPTANLFLLHYSGGAVKNYSTTTATISIA